MSNVNVTRLGFVSVAKWSNGERELVRHVSRLVELDAAFGLPECELFDYLRPYHGLTVGAAIAQAKSDVLDAIERNADCDIDDMARESSNGTF